ncbi:MAG: hypothetical protein KJ630_16610 [Proteobacteria bacterium]|nr:hypothetical protein [Pseudomonadota bacterium]
MKSNNFVTAASILLVVTYLLVMRIQIDEPGDMTRFIPKTALVYFEQRKGYEIFKKFSTSSLGKKIESIDFAEVAKEIGEGDEVIAVINNFAIAVKFIQTNKLIKELCEKRFALAVLLPFDNSLSPLNKSDFLQENLVLIAEPNHPAKVIEMLAAAYQGSSGIASFSSGQYGRHRIMRIVQDGQTFSLVKIEGVFVMSQNERQLRLCIDTFDGEQPSFSGNAEFLAVKNSFPAPDSLLALPLKNAGEYLPALFADYDFFDTPFFAGKWSSLQGLIGLGYSAKKHQSAIKEKILFRYVPDGNVSDVMRDQHAIRATKPSRLSLTTPSPMFYLWSNAFNLEGFLPSTLTGGEGWSDDTDIVARLEAITGKEFDYQAMFSKEVIVVAEPAAESSSLPLPLAMIFIRISDKDTLKAILKEILDIFKIPFETGEYGPAEYVYWSQSPQDGLVPLYGFFGELFFLGNSETFLQKIIDTNNRGLSLLDIDSIKKITPGLEGENNWVIYSNNVQLIEILKIGLNTMGTLMAIEDRELSIKAQVIFNKILTPVLDGAKMYDASFTRSYYTPEMIVIDVITHISNYH